MQSEWNIIKGRISIQGSVVKLLTITVSDIFVGTEENVTFYIHKTYMEELKFVPIPTWTNLYHIQNTERVSRRTNFIHFSIRANLSPFLRLPLALFSKKITIKIN